MPDYPDADRYIPATPVALGQWCGPVDVDLGDGVIVHGTLVGADEADAADRAGEWLVFPDNGEWPDMMEAYGLDRSVCGADIRLDPKRQEVRDHLLRRLSLPAWMRDGAHLEPWASAGLVACGAARHAAGMPALVKVFPPWGQTAHQVRRREWDRIGDGDGRYLFLRDDSYLDAFHGDENRPLIRRSRWSLTNAGRSPHPTAEGKAPTEEQARDDADAAALALGCALMLDADTLVLPYPDGPRTWRRP